MHLGVIAPLKRNFPLFQVILCNPYIFISDFINMLKQLLTYRFFYRHSIIRSDNRKSLSSQIVEVKPLNEIEIRQSDYQVQNLPKCSLWHNNRHYNKTCFSSNFPSFYPFFETSLTIFLLCLLSSFLFITLSFTTYLTLFLL